MSQSDWVPPRQKHGTAGMHFSVLSCLGVWRWGRTFEVEIQAAWDTELYMDSSLRLAVGFMGARS